MRSYQAVSYEIDDIEQAVDELLVQLKAFSLQRNTCGLVFCDYDVDTELLAKLLKERLDFPIMGMTGVGFLTNEGYSEQCISFLVMTGDDCEFSMKMTDPLDCDADIGKLAEAYQEAGKVLSEKEKLIFLYVPLLSLFSWDIAINALSEAVGNVPIFGGVAGDSWTYTNCSVFCNGVVSYERAIMLLISGNIKPIVKVEHSTTHAESSHHIVTKARGYLVYEIDNRPMLDYLQEMGLTSQNEDVSWDFCGTPFLVKRKMPNGDSMEVLRSVGLINYQKRYCGFLSKVEEGDEINMELISKEDIERSVKVAFDELLQEIASSEDYRYSMILCSSCVMRYCMIVADKNIEGSAYAGRLPEGLSVHGYYGYGEICSTVGRVPGKFYNIFTHETLAMIAI